MLKIGRTRHDALPNPGRTRHHALTIVTPFTDPLLDGTAHGRWNPQLQIWTR